MKIYIKRQRYRTRDSQLDWVRAGSGRPRAIVLVPPLIGGIHAQQIRYFRQLIPRGYDLVSFSYRGHGNSRGRFCLSSTVDDTMAMAINTRRLADRESIPLHGIGCCYSAIPILSAADEFVGKFDKIVLINAVSRVDLVSMASSFISYYRRFSRHSRLLPGLFEALFNYLDLLFPTVAKSRNSFGELRLERVNRLKIARECISFSPLKSTMLKKTPVLCIYGVRDNVLNLNSPRFEQAYKSEFMTLCPNIDYLRLECDHYLSHPFLRSIAARAIGKFLGES